MLHLTNNNISTDNALSYGNNPGLSQCNISYIIGRKQYNTECERLEQNALPVSITAKQHSQMHRNGNSTRLDTRKTGKMHDSGSIRQAGQGMTPRRALCGVIISPYQPALILPLWTQEHYNER